MQIESIEQSSVQGGHFKHVTSGGSILCANMGSTKWLHPCKRLTLDQ